MNESYNFPPPPPRADDTAGLVAAYVFMGLFFLTFVIILAVASYQWSRYGWGYDGWMFGQYPSWYIPYGPYPMPQRVPMAPSRPVPLPSMPTPTVRGEPVVQAEVVDEKKQETA